MTDKVVNIINEEPFVGEDGLDYIKVTKEILTPRKTYLKGTISGKYRGDKIPDDSDKSNLFDFEIYEAVVTCNSIDDFSKNKPFVFPRDFKNITNSNKIKGTIFPKEKLPQTLPVVISANNKTFGINVLEPQLYEFSINRKEHQIEGDEVFGTFSAFMIGYVFDYEKEEIEEIIGPIIELPPLPPPKPYVSNGIKTGKEEKKDGYIRYEYFSKHHPDTVWGPWINVGGRDREGCFSQIFAIIGLLLFIVFIVAILPGIIYFIGFLIAIFVIGLLAPYLKWVFRIFGLIMLLMFIGSLVNTCTNGTRHYNPIPIVDPVIQPVVDTMSTPSRDYWIVRHRNWTDYDGNKYEGYYKVKRSSFDKAHYYKNNINLAQNSTNKYDQIVYNLKENDKSGLANVYTLFDSIGKENKLDKVKFAKMIVSFVQKIPYAIVLEDACDARLYNDSFTRQYLNSGQGDCDPNERFGINTPIEFLVNMKGDCDTRTLLLYTLLSHYDYDVAMMSSEFYGHSILGINLPINGKAYVYKNQRYVLWETTTANSKPGIISNEISNLNNWRISLKSK